jgi:hypothetical protein
MEILEHQHQQPPRCHALQRPEQLPEDHALPALRVVGPLPSGALALELGQQSSERRSRERQARAFLLARTVRIGSQRLDHRHERRRAGPERRAGAPQDDRLAPRPPRELIHQPRLADPGLTADQHGR